MPLALKTIELETREINSDDTGILVQTKPRNFAKNPHSDVLFWLNGFADDYWKLKNPELEVNAPEEVPKEEISEESSKNGEITNGNGEAKESEEKKNAEEKKDTETKAVPQSPPKRRNSTPIQFVVRDINLENQSLVFVASNLEDPGDYLHYVFDQMATVEKKRRTKFPIKAMPVHGLCIAKPREMEELSSSIVERLVNDDQIHRFSIQFYGSMDGENMTQKEASAIVRNCIWAANPNCIQCIKYQEVAFTIDIIKPFFCIGYLHDYVKLRRYMTYNMKLGYDLCGEGDDSEDDISDDPTLDEEEDKRRKLRIKRKRNAEKAQLSGAGDGSNSKVVAEGEEEEDNEVDISSADKNGSNEEIEKNGDGH